MPMISGLACITDSTKASIVCPESVRPEASDMVIDTCSSGLVAIGSVTSANAARAALRFRVSKHVSMIIPSAPLSKRVFICSWYAVAISSNVTLRAAGSLTSSLMDSMRLVGPTSPMTYRLLVSPAAAISSTAWRASLTASRFISSTISPAMYSCCDMR